MVHHIRDTELLTWFLIFGIIMIGSISGGVFFAFSEETAMLIARGIASIGAFLFLICTIILWTFMKGYGRSQTVARGYSLSTSIKLFNFVMTIASMTGYFLHLPYIWILKDYDFALNYTYFVPMIVTDVFYIISILFYLPTQLFYLWFYFPVYGFFENPEGFSFYKALFGLTLIVNFWQKWLYETLIAREEICEELFLQNRTCIGYRHYRTNITMMSDGERDAYATNELISPIAYSCTMEILVVYLVVLCYCRATTQNRQVNRVDNSSRFVTTSVFLKFSAIIGMILLLITAIVYIGFSYASMFHDHKNPRETERLINQILKISVYVLGAVVFTILVYLFWDVKSEEQEKRQQIISSGNDAVIEEQEQHGCFCKFCILCWLCPSTFHEPDLLILQITWWITLCMSTTRMLLQCYGFYYNEQVDWSEVSTDMIPAALTLITNAFNVKLLMSFLSTSNSTLIQLSRDSFTKRYMVPFQVFRSFLKAFSIFVSLLDPEAPPLRDDATDQWVCLINAAYPFTVLMSITSALCWAHVLEKFFNHGAYNVRISIADTEYQVLENAAETEEI